MKVRSQITNVIAVVIALFLFACAPQANTMDPGVEATPDSPKEFDVEFTLKTLAKSGKLLYIGVGGDIDGVINPDLIVHPGEVVRLILVNGDGIPHDLFVPDWDVKTEYVSKIGEEAEIVFEVGTMQPGTYVYYCTMPGHRQAGQEGNLIVSQK